MDDPRGLARAAQEVARCIAQDKRPPRVRPSDGESHFGPLFTVANHRVLPPVLLQQYDNVQYKCFVGLLPEIHRAWITFDNRLFLWKYDDDKDFNVWDGLDQVIVSVGLVVPKPGVFVETIRYLLVVTTPVEIVVLGVSFSNDDIQGEMVLQPTDLSVPSDEVNMLQVVGTPQGRIFMGGFDGNLYELDYAAPGSGGWFTLSSRRCRKVNHTQGLIGSLVPFLSNLYANDPIQELRHDRSRNMLYALTSSSTIQGYWLGNDGMSLHHFASRAQLESDANVRARVYAPTDFQIASIWPVSAAESARIHLVALASSGVRVYLTTTPNPADKPYALQVVHVDHPVRDMRNRGTHCTVQASLFSHGCLLMSAAADGGATLAAASVDAEKPLFCAHFDMSAKERGSTMDEPCATLRLSGTTWAIGEAPLPSIVSNAELFPALVPPVNVANELATQHFVQRRFLCLTNRGLYAVERRRPVDQLLQVLAQSQGNPDTEELRLFFSYYGEAEAHAMCLVVACASVGTPSASITNQMHDWAASAFLHFGSGNAATGPSVAASQAGGLPGGVLGQGQGGGVGNASILLGRPLQQLSDRYSGFCLFLGRLLYPVWQVPINRITVYSKDEVRTIRDNLVNLLAFVEQSRWSGASVGNIGGTAGGADALQQQQQQQQLEQQRAPFPARVLESLQTRTPHHLEQAALAQLVLLLSRACQALNMLIVLNEHDVGIIDRLTTDRTVTAAPFADLVAGTTGTAIIKLLIGYLMKSNSDETDIMSKELSAACPMYFNQADRDFFLAIKLLREAAPQQNLAARADLQQEAMVLFRRIAANLTFQDAFAVLNEMQDQGLLSGMAELAMLVAQARDKQRPADADDRQRCYGVIAKTLERLLVAGDPTSAAAASAAGGSGGSAATVSASVAATSAALAATGEAPLEQYRRLKRMVLQHCGEECARHLFGWYLSRGLLAELVEIESPLLESFLRANDPVFLAEYYTANHRFGDAAAAYLALADAPAKPGDGLDLNQRILYLGHAVANVKQADGHGVPEGQVRLLTEKAEVAQIQRRIFNELQSVPGGAAPVDLERLNARLFTISELYNQFAWPMQLWETCLVIMHTANHECPRPLVEKLWSSIVQQERRTVKTAPATVASLSRKVETVARVSSLSLKVFPVDVICELLETLSFEALRSLDGFDAAWVARLMLTVGVSHHTLFDLYHRLFASLDSNRPRQLHFSSPLRFVMEQWLGSGFGPGGAAAFGGAASGFARARSQQPRIAVALLDDIILRLEEVPQARDEVAQWKQLVKQMKDVR